MKIEDQEGEAGKIFLNTTSDFHIRAIYFINIGTSQQAGNKLTTI